MSKPIRVVVVEDSAVQRAAIVRLLREGGGIEIVAEAGSVDEAVRAVDAKQPDVVTMDLEIPGGPVGTPGGLLAIKRIMGKRTLPILVLSSHAATRSDTLAIEALAAGAVDVFPKRATWEPTEAAALRRRIAVLSRLTMVSRHARTSAHAPGTKQTGSGRPVVALAASTGGPSALRIVISGLAGLGAPLLVVQHIHDDFSESFAGWISETTGVDTRVAAAGEELRAGLAYLAPPGHHLRLGPGMTAEVSPEPAAAPIRPSADELLGSVARRAARSAVGCVLTGMGADGAHGLLAIRHVGGATFAQDAASSVVDGMPRAARELGAAQVVAPVDDLAAVIRRAVAERGR